MTAFERVLLWTIRGGIGLLLCFPFIVTSGMLFPFITGKNFFFRIIVELITGAWLGLIMLNASFRPKKSILAIAIAIFMGAVTLATITSANPYMSFWSNFERMEGLITYVHLGALFVVASSAFRDPREWAYIFHGSLGVSLIVAFYAFLQARGIVAIVGEYRPYAWFGNSIYLAEYLLFHLFLTFFFLLTARQQWLRAVYGAIIFFEGYLFLIAASRGAFIGFIAGVVVIAGGFFLKSSSRRIKISVAGGALVLAFLFVLLFLFPDNFLAHRIEVIERLTSVNVAGLKHDPRILMWDVGWRAFLARPILGWGPGNFIEPYSRLYNPELHGNEPWFDRVHNMLIEWLMATGIVGFLAFLCMFGAAFYLAFTMSRAKKDDWRLGIVLLAFGVAYLVQNIFVFDSIGTYIALFMWFAAIHTLSGTRHIQEHKRRARHLSSGQKVGLAGLGCVTLICVYAVNVSPMRAAYGTLGVLQQFGEQKSVEEITASVVAVEDLNTFGTTELHERFGNEVMNAIIQQDGRQKLAFNLIDEAVRNFEYEVRYAPESAKAQLFLGRLYALRFNVKKSVNDARSAEDAYKKSLTIAPRYIQTYVALAELYLMTGRQDDAVRVIDDAFLMAPRSEELMYAGVFVHEIANNPAGALRIVEEYSGLHGNIADRKNFGEPEIARISDMASYIKDPKERLNFLERFAEWAKPTADLFIALANAADANGADDRAREYAARAITINPAAQTRVSAILDIATSSATH